MKNVFKYLAQSEIVGSEEVDKLIVSAFLEINKVNISHNILIKSYVLSEANPKDFERLVAFISLIRSEVIDFDFEKLIELFEFVVSPSEKVINGAVYTPKNIRDYIVDKSIASYDGDIDLLQAADISCGCGGFLLTLTQRLKTLTNKPFRLLYSQHIFGIDIASYSIDRTKILLALYAVMNGEDELNFKFNLFTGDSLTFAWRDNCEAVAANGGFDIIVGNPPYVCSRNMDANTLELMKNWEVARTGHPDLYIPFFQIGIENLNETGILGYITVNTFIKSINGRALREYFAVNNVNLILLNFGGEQVFQDRNTYTCICFLRLGNGAVNYQRLASNELQNVNLDALMHFDYGDLNHHDGWNLVNGVSDVNFINTIETTGVPFKETYNTKNGIATLKNDVYKFQPVDQDEDFYYLQDGGQRFRIEIGICRDIINANKLKVEADIDRIREKIIFPYDERTIIISQDIMQTNFPHALAYLITKRVILSARDKGARNYETWYAYGRRQSMDIHAYKLFFPHICERPSFVICQELDLLFYNGMAIISDSLEDLLVIKKILESNLFYKYISSTTKDYASGYISMSRNYLKNFGVYQFTDAQRVFLTNNLDVNNFLEELYGVTRFLNDGPIA